MESKVGMTSTSSEVSNSTLARSSSSASAATTRRSRPEEDAMAMEKKVAREAGATSDAEGKPGKETPQEDKRKSVDDFSAGTTIFQKEPRNLAAGLRENGKFSP